MQEHGHAAAHEGQPLKGPSAGEPSRRREVWACSLSLLGPGMLAMLADTDAGCLIVAADSGARFGYSLVLLMVLLTPILFMAQELTVRLGVHLKMGLVRCIRRHYGERWSVLVCVLLLLTGMLAEISELSGIAAVGELWDLPRWASVLLSCCLLIGLVFGLPYKHVEAIGITFGLCECVFIVTMFMSHTKPREIVGGLVHVPIADSTYAQLVTANVGAVIMAWMIYFQQGAIVARRLGAGHEEALERTDTLVGAFATQLIMIGTMVTLAAANHNGRPRAELTDVQAIVDALALTIGPTAAKVLLSLGFLGGSLCAALVVGLAVAWGVTEGFGVDDLSAEAKEYDESIKNRPTFYVCFLLVVLLGALILLAGVDVVRRHVLARESPTPRARHRAHALMCMARAGAAQRARRVDRRAADARDARLRLPARDGPRAAARGARARLAQVDGAQLLRRRDARRVGRLRVGHRGLRRQPAPPQPHGRAAARGRPSGDVGAAASRRGLRGEHAEHGRRARAARRALWSPPMTVLSAAPLAALHTLPQLRGPRARAGSRLCIAR